MLHVLLNKSFCELCQKIVILLFACLLVLNLEDIMVLKWHFWVMHFFLMVAYFLSKDFLQTLEIDWEHFMV